VLDTVPQRVPVRGRYRAGFRSVEERSKLLKATAHRCFVKNIAERVSVSTTFTEITRIRFNTAALNLYRDVLKQFVIHFEVIDIWP
jgi:hypothetical protein